MRDHSPAAVTDQDQEFELVLGNKQLFSMLFIVFVLLGVFFAMGYLLGRNSAPADSASRNSPEASRPEGDSVPASKRSALQTPSQRIAINDPEPAASQTTSTETPTIPAPIPSTGARAAREEPAELPASESGVISVTEPRPGQVYVQAIALARPEAEVIVEILTHKKFHAILAPGPNEKVFRVLVGPVQGDSETSKLRSELEQAGFKPFPRKY